MQDTTITRELLQSGAPYIQIANSVTTKGGATENIVNGGATRAPSQIISGRSNAGATIEIYDRDQLVGTAISNGFWMFTFGDPGTSSGLDDGLHVLRARNTGMTGQAAWSTVLAFTVARHLDLDMDPYAVTDRGSQVSTGYGATTRDNTLLLRGHADPGATIQLASNHGPLGSTTAGASGDWQFATPALAEGTYQFSASAQDAAGNSADAQGPTLSIDSHVSAASIDHHIGVHSGKNAVSFDGVIYTSDARPILSGTAEAGSAVVLYDNDIAIAHMGPVAPAATPGSAPLWAYTLPTRAGASHYYQVQVIDAAGNAAMSDWIEVYTTPYVGSARGERLSGTRAANVIVGGGGADTIRAGAGDDLILVSDQAYASIDGGTGHDTLRVGIPNGSFALTLGNVFALASIEAIDIRTAGHTDMLVQASAVQILARSANVGPALLDIRLDADDDLYLYAEGSLRWFDRGRIVDSHGQAWHLYGHAALSAASNIDAVIRVGIPPGSTDAPVHIQ